MTEHLVDATGLACPLPILRARRALNTVEAGAKITVLATDPAAISDFPAFCRQTGHVLVEYSAGDDGVLRFVLRKSGETPERP